VVNVSSSLHKVPSVLSVVDDPLFAKGYSLFPAYAQVHFFQRFVLFPLTRTNSRCP
jgi:hypothetical protein